VTDPGTGPTTGPGPPTDGRARATFEWLFRNRRTGQVTIAQFPNLPLWLFFVTVVLRRIVTTGSAAHTALDWAGVVTLGGWAVDEVVRGVNPWRKILGTAVGAAVVAGVVSMVS
jgi:hypothetical protein